MEKDLEYYYWENELKFSKQKRSWLISEDFTKELSDLYLRQESIFEEILIDLAPQLEDDQYSGTVSSGYEKEIEDIRKKIEILEPIIEEKTEQFNHQKLLQDLGMTQEQYDDHMKEVETFRIKKKRR